MSKQLLSLILFAAIFQPSARGSGADAAVNAKFERSPFLGVCEDVAMLPRSSYSKNKEYWDNAILQCGANVQVLPETGFFSNMMGAFDGVDFNSDEKKKAVAFLRKLGQKTVDNIDYNAKQMERQIHCADQSRGSDWFAAKLKEAKELAEKNNEAGKAEAEFYDPNLCERVISDLKNAVAEQGSEFRVQLEMMKVAAGGANVLASKLRKVFRQEYAGEKLALSSTEKERVRVLTTEMDQKISANMTANMRKNIEKFNELKKTNGEVIALNDSSLAPWFRQWYRESDHGTNPNSKQAQLHWNRESAALKQEEFGAHYASFSKALKLAPIVAYLGSREPSSKELAEAAAKLLKNTNVVREEVVNALEKTKGKSGEYYSLSEQEKIDELVRILKNGEVVKNALIENPGDCRTAVGLVNFVSTQDAKNGALVTVGLIGAGIFAPIVVGPLGATAGIAGAGFTVTGATVAGAIGVAGGAYSLYSDSAAAKDGARRVLIYSHSDSERLGAGKPITDVSDLLDTRNALAINAAIQTASLGAMGASGIYAKFFAENQSQYQTQGVLKQLMKAKSEGGAGLTENEAKQLLRNVGSQEKGVAREALSKLFDYMGGDASELRLYQSLVRKELLDPEMKSIFEPFSRRLQALRATEGGPEKAKQLLKRADEFASHFAANEINPAKRADALRLMLASSEFGVEDSGVVISAAQRVKEWPEGVGGLARAFDQARETMLQPDIQKLAPELRRSAAFERALRKLGVKDSLAVSAMSKCALGKGR